MKFMGTLGQVDHYRCENCGLDQSVTVGMSAPTCCVNMDACPICHYVLDDCECMDLYPIDKDEIA